MKDLHNSTKGVRGRREIIDGLQVKKKSLQVELSTKIMVQEVWFIHCESWVLEDSCKSLCLYS